MDKLIRAGLYGASLLPINSPVLLRRYNLALKALGITATELSSFHIDGLGWSPEVAKEKGNPYYMSASLATPMAIILSPSQKNLAVYFPFHSYDRNILDSFFHRFGTEIADVTRSSFLCLELDHELSFLQSPEDLLLFSEIIVRPHSEDIVKAALVQKALVDRLQGESLAWFDSNLRLKVIESAQEFGDLRYRKLYIPDFRLPINGSFHSIAFGGVFVVRPKKGEPFLICEQEEQASDGIFYARSIEAFDKILNSSFFDLNSRVLVPELEKLEELRELMIAKLVCFEYPELEAEEINIVSMRRKLRSISSQKLRTLGELERLIKLLETRQSVDYSSLSIDLISLLVSSCPKLIKKDIGIVSSLLFRTQEDIVDHYRCYLLDKRYYYSKYLEWPESYKLWSIKCILRKRKGL